MTGGYGTKKRLLCCKRMIIFLFIHRFHWYRHCFLYDFMAQGATMQTSGKSALRMRGHHREGGARYSEQTFQLESRHEEITNGDI